MTDPISDADLAKIDELIIIRSEYRGKHPKARSVAQSEYYRGRIDDFSSEIIDAFPAILSRLTAAEQDRDDTRSGWEQAAETIRELEGQIKSVRDRAYAEGREAERERCSRIAEDDEGHFTWAGTDEGVAIRQQVAREIAQAIRGSYD